MGTKQEDHNRGQQDASKAGVIEDLVHAAFPVGSEEYNRGYLHGEQQRAASRYGSSGAPGCGVALAMPILIVLMIFGVYLKHKEKSEAIRSLKTMQFAISVSDDRGNPAAVLRDSHGISHSVRVAVSWNGPLEQSGRPLRMTILRDRAVVFERTFEDPSNGQLNAEVPGEWPSGRYLVRVAAEGAPNGEYWFTVRPMPPGSIFVTDQLFNGAPQEQIQVLKHQPGQLQKIYTIVSAEGPMPAKGKDVYVQLIHDGEYLFNYSYPVKENSRRFMVIHEADFGSGVYTARLFGKGDPATDYSFRVENIIPETPDEKNRQVSGYLNTVLPGSSRPPLIIGLVRTCESVRGWKDFVSKSQFVPGETLCIYSEALYANQNGQIDVNFRARLLDSTGQAVGGSGTRVTYKGTDPSCWAPMYAKLPPDISPGLYTASVDATDNLGGRVGTATVQFVVSNSDSGQK